jgi:hypothetical protein
MKARGIRREKPDPAWFRSECVDCEAWETSDTLRLARAWAAMHVRETADDEDGQHAVTVLRSVEFVQLATGE